MSVLIMPKCETCRYWTHSEQTELEGYRICKRYPPNLFIDEDGDIAQFWPTVRKDNHCGEHMPGMAG